jgi:hypothetical protein
MKQLLLVLLIAGCGINDKFDGGTGGNGDLGSGAAPDLSVASDLAPAHPAGAVNGTKCGGGGECQSGNCVDGVCCHDSSCGVCAACNINGLGYCSALSAGTADSRCATQDPSTCGTTGKCDGKLACAVYDNKTICGVERCEMGPSRAFHSTAYCSTAGQTCTQPFDDCKGYACYMSGVGTAACYIQCSCVGSKNYCDTNYHCANCDSQTQAGTCVHN